MDKAIADLTEAIRIDPMPRSDGPPPVHINLHFNRGIVWHAKGDYDRAMQDYNQAISLDAKDAEAFYYRARLHFLYRDFDRALADMTEAGRLDPKNPDIAAALEDFRRIPRSKGSQKRSK